jgi:riboflavin transport system permease protein
MTIKTAHTGFVLPNINALPALAIALTAATIYILAAADDPLVAFRAFFVSPFANGIVFLNLVEQMAAPCLCALGAALVFRSGGFNLGGEGQAYAGSVAAAIGLLALRGVPGPMGLVAGFVMGALAGALISLPSALSRRLAGVDILLSTFLVSQAVVLVLDWALAGPLRDPASNLLATPIINPKFLLPRFSPPSNLSPAILLAAFAAFAFDYFLRRSRRGMEMSLFGRNPVFARSVGMNVSAYAFWPLIISGALHGLAGALLVLGINGRAVRGMTGGIGWTGIAIALVAGNDPRWTLPAAFLFSWLDSGARQAAILAGLSADVSIVTKAIVLLLATAHFLKPLRKGGRG